MVSDLAAAREFAAQWAGKGYEKGECQKFWTLLLRDVLGYERMDEAERIYEDIKTWYVTFARSKDGMACIAAFDSAMPNYKEKLTAVKKIDYLLWSKR